MILDYLKDHGSINCSQAFRALNVGALHSRIADLRRKGYVFRTETYAYKDRHGRTLTGWRYRLIKEMES